MEIIGAGFGRTGTMSLQAALEELGYQPCYHMKDVLTHPDHIQFWQRAAGGEEVDWADFFREYKAGLDYPLAGFYKEILATFPTAKVILTVRDPERWYESTRETIYRGTAIPAWLTRLIPAYRGLQKMVQDSIWKHIFEGRFEDRSYALQVFENHVEDVKQTVPKGQLLIFEVKQGWGPLCEFLGKPVPAKPFPHINDRRTTRLMYAGLQVVSVVALVGVAALLYWLLRLVF